MALDPAQPASLQPRYRRPLTFGAILDETFQIYRRTWLKAVGMWTLSTGLGIVAVALVGGGLGALGGLAFLSLLGNPQRALSGQDPAATAALLAGVGLIGLVAGVAFALFYTAAITGITTLVYRFLHGQPTSFWGAYGRGIGRIPVVVACGFVFFLALLLLSVPTMLLVIPAMIVGWLVATIALVVWAARATARQPWLKWLIILTTPFGLITYFSVKWSLWMQAIVLERASPIQALRRSGDLVRGSWFRVFGTWLVLAVVTYILQAIPGALLGLGAFVITGAQDDPNAATWFNLANYAGSLLGGLLFGSITFIAFTLLFVDLRNRHEGTDLDERLAQLEGRPSRGSQVTGHGSRATEASLGHLPPVTRDRERSEPEPA